MLRLMGDTPIPQNSIDLLQKEKERLIQEIAEEIERIASQIALVNKNVDTILNKQKEITAFAELWTTFRIECQREN